MNEKEARPPWAEWHESLPTELRAQPLDDVWRVIDDSRKCFPGAFPPGTPFPPYSSNLPREGELTPRIDRAASERLRRASCRAAFAESGLDERVVPLPLQRAA
jgi:hypothetical protein